MPAPVERGVRRVRGSFESPEGAEMDERKVSAIDLFADLSRSERRQLAASADEVDVEEGRELVREGEFAYEFFVIEEGSAEVLRDGEHVADLGPGDFLGEMGIVGKTRRNASVVARSPMSLIVMTVQDFQGMTRAMPAVAGRIQQTVQERSQTLVC
jgi:CRP/FNR family transcriptional regulator, cyclic AMP receptor protein